MPTIEKRRFESRDELAAYLRGLFPLADGGISPIQGGHAEAERRLALMQPARYAATRNYLDGAVTRLSPYLRHGVLSLREVRLRARRDQKLVSELAWRDYWQRVYAQIGDGVWEDRERPKREWRAAERAELPVFPTGLACMDAFASELLETGYLHNHARMWMASWLIHWARVRWQVAAKWFLQHLLDGDPASNNLSFQWVAGTFASKPYIFNRENLEKYTRGKYCASCTAQCPFNASYEVLDERLFTK